MLLSLANACTISDYGRNESLLSLFISCQSACHNRNLMMSEAMLHTHRRPRPANVWHDTPPGKLLLSWVHYLPWFFFRALGSGSLVSYVGGECWPSAVWKCIAIDMCWVPAPFSPSQLVLRLPCYISVCWYAVFNETNLSSRGASLWRLSTPLPEILSFFYVTHLSVNQPEISYVRIFFIAMKICDVIWNVSSQVNHWVIVCWGYMLVKNSHVHTCCSDVKYLRIIPLKHVKTEKNRVKMWDLI